MLDAALIQQCADPALKLAIVEQFVEAAGAPDPLTVMVRSGNRVFPVPKPKDAQEALAIIRDNVGRAVVRVGLTQFPASVAVKDASELNPDLVDPCENLRMGTKMFAKILRIVTRWYGNPKTEEVFPQIFEDAIYAWKTGEFEGKSVFQAEDPIGEMAMPQDQTSVAVDPEAQADVDSDTHFATPEMDAETAGIRVDLSRILGK